MHVVSNDCTKNKCWLKRPIAKTEAAELAECDVNDFLLVESGKIYVHESKSTVQHMPLADNDVDDWNRYIA